MAASMCDVFSFCVGVAGRARGSVEVRFVNSAKVRPGRTGPGGPRGETHAHIPESGSLGANLVPAWARGAESVLVPRLVARSRGGRGEAWSTGGWPCCFCPGWS